MRAIRKFSLSLAATGILLLLAIALTSGGASSRFSQSSPPKASAKTAVAQTMKTYTMYSGLWRTDGGFVSTIRVKNILVVAPLDVTPLLYMADGTPYMLPSVHVPVSGVVTVNVNDALAAAPQSVAGHVSQFGSVALIHTYSSPGHVSASMAVIDASRSLSFTFPFSEPMGDPMQQTLEGLWWKHDPDASGWIALSNVSDAAAQANVQLVGPGNAVQPSRTIALSPHTTHMFHLEDFASNPSPLVKDAGGIRVQYTGQPGSVQVTGGLENDSEGYSANIPFWGHDMSSAPATSITYASAGLMIGKPDPMMMPGFPKDTTFTPYLVLRNTTEKPLDVGLQLNYMTGMGSSSMSTNSSAPVTRSLPTQHLAPGEAKQVDIQSAINSARFGNFNGSINLSTSFTGKGGDLVLASGSVDQTGTYVFEVEPQGVSATHSKFSNYWGVADGNDTMFSLWNPTDTAQDILATFYYADGSGKYVLSVHLEPQASTMIDMAMLIMEMKPDGSGNIIPPSVQEGSAQFSSVKGRNDTITLVIAGGIYNVSTATCGNNCTTCCGDSNFGINPGVLYVPFGGSFQCGVTTVDCNGLEVYPSSWTSSNTAVMTVNSSGNVQGVSVGSATITASYLFAPVYTGQVCNTSCPTSNPAPQATGTVGPSNFKISVTSTPVQNETNSVISGQQAQVSVTAVDNNGNTVTSYTGTVHFTSTDTKATLPADYTYTSSDSGVHAFNVTLVTVSGNSATSPITVSDSAYNISSTQNINLWFQVIATREGLVGGTTACNHVITQNDHFVALPATSMCSVGVRLRNGANLATTSVLDVGPWCPNTPVQGGFNQCSCPSDRYWQTTGVPFAATASCATTHAGIDLADGTFNDLGLTTNGNIYWRFQ